MSDDSAWFTRADDAWGFRQKLAPDLSGALPPVKPPKTERLPEPIDRKKPFAGSTQATSDRHDGCAVADAVAAN